MDMHIPGMNAFELVRLPEGTLSGRPQPLGDVATANCVVIQELGSEPELASNLAIVDRYEASDSHVLSLPVFASASLAKTLHERGHGEKIVVAFRGKSATNRAENTGTQGELEQYRNYSRGFEAYDRPIFFTSGYNVGNVVRQAVQLGIEGIVPANLPRVFDRRSKQFWTKNRTLWMASAHLRLGLLAAKGH